MNTSPMHPRRSSPLLLNPYTLVCLGSLFLSVLALATDQVFNPDGARYLKGAFRFLHGATGPYEYSGWPFYEMVIGSVSYITSMTPVYAAHFINTILITGTCIAFVRLFRECFGTDIQPTYFSVVSILLLTGLNNSRDEIIRDPGYIFFMLSSLVFLIIFLRKSKLRYLLGWFLSLSLACLFRIEGIIFFIAMPIITIFAHPRRENMAKDFALMIIPCFISLSALLSLIAFFPDSLPRLDKLVSQLSRLGTVFGENGASEIIKNELLYRGSDRSDGSWFLVGGSISLILKTILSCLGAFVGFALLSGFTISQIQTRSNQAAVRLAFGTAIACALYLIVFVLIYRFCTTRYVFLISLMLTIFASRNLCILFNRCHRPQSKRKLIILFSVLGILSVHHSGVLRSDKKEYVLQAAEKIQRDYSDYELYTNHYYIDYSSEFQSRFFRRIKTSTYKDLNSIEKNQPARGAIFALYVRTEDDKVFATALKEKGFTLENRFRQKNRSIELYTLQTSSK